MKAVAAMLCALGVALGSPRALAQVPDGGTELSTLQTDMEREALETESADCLVACRALESMRKAADRICAIDPGAPCARAREKVAQAQERVRAACPQCAATTKDEEKQAASPAAPPPAETAEAPRKGGGCAGCAAAPSDPTGLTALGVAAAALLAAKRRRRR